MSEEKRIEELAWDLCDIPRHPSIKSCDECGNKHCHAIYYAKRAINKGYRKQIEGEWVKERREWDMPPFFYVDYTCSACQQREQNKSPYCRWCGAKMKERIAHEQERNAPGE